MLEHRIPPPLIMLLAIAGIYISQQTSVLEPLQFAPQYRLGALMICIGGFICLMGVLRFKQHQTTVNPLAPESASTLVTGGIFDHTRNPMYLGMAIVIAGSGAILGNAISLLWLLAFVLYMQVFQIRPEEKAMQQLFGDQYRQYCLKVRRWI